MVLLKTDILDVVMLSVVDIGELAAVDNLIVDPHIDPGFKKIGAIKHIFSNNLGNGGSPR